MLQTSSRIFMARKTKPEPFIQLHRDGSVRAKGQVIDRVPTGYWEWFRRDGTLMRSGHFEDGVQVGQWTTYDQAGRPYRVTDKRDGGDRRTRTVLAAK